MIDTAGFLALWDSTDTHHPKAVKLLSRLSAQGRRVITSDYVIDETATLLLVRHSHQASSDFLKTIENSEAIALEWIGPDRFQSTSRFFRKHSDKKWSFTDCTSFCLMQELRLSPQTTTSAKQDSTRSFKQMRTK